MKIFITIFFCVTIFFSPSEGAIEADRVDILPGFSDALPEPQYSGYLDISDGKHLHYWLVLSANNKTEDPLVLWFNGGPGCSSLDGFFYEHGPFRINNTVSPPTLRLNPHRWNLLANIVFIEAPAGVGLSYADTPEGNYNNDRQQAIDNFEALLKFYDGFPEYREHKLIITGESYAGMYVPTLALQVLSYNEKSENPIPFDGIMVGNGVIGSNTGINSRKLDVEYLHGHGLYSNAVYQSIVKECGDFSTITAQCQHFLNLMHDEVGRVNIYDIYGPCISSDSKTNVWRAPPSNLQLNGSRIGAQGPVACLDGAPGADYLNQADVRKAIHVKSVEEIGEWHLCGGKLRYTKNWGSLLPFYKNDIIPRTRVCIFNGEADACVPYNHNEEWTSTLGVPVVETWRSWDVEGQVAGFVTEYENDFTFVTVKGAGHMVPETHPIQALAMFERFIKHEPF